MSSLTLERMIFDPSNPADGPSIGSYLVSLGGNVITDTGSALDVNIQSSDVDIQVDLDVTSLLADDVNKGSENPLTVSGIAYDQSGALGALSAADDKGHLLMDLYRRVYINDAPNIGALMQAVSVDTTAGGVAIPTTPLAGRTRLMVQNNGDKSIFVGTGTVTTANGLEVGKGSTLTLEAGEAIAWKAIADSGTQDVRVLEWG